MRIIMKFLKGYGRECVLAPLFKMLEAIFELFVPLVVSSIIDKGIANEDTAYIIKMCIVLLMLAAVGLFSSITAQYFSARAAVGCATGLRHSLFEHIQGFSFTEIDNVGESTLITRMTSDINQVQNGVNMVLRLFLRSPFIVFGAMIMAFTIDVKSALIFVVTIPVLAVIVFGIMLFTRPLYKRVQADLDRVLGRTRQNLTGARVIRAFNKQQDEIEHFERENGELSGLQKYVGMISGLMNPLTYVVVNIAVIVLIRVGGIRVDSGAISQGQVVALYNYMSQILIELVKLANLIILITKALACAGRIQGIFDINTGMSVSDMDNSGNKTSEIAVEFKNVSFMYDKAGANAIEDVSFKVFKGQTIGVIGGTGSGKSSLINLIPRFYDATGGEVLINGIDIKCYPLEELHSKVSVVMQKAVLFKGTVRDNLKMGNDKASDEDIEEALVISQSKEFVDSKEGRLDYMLEQGGKNLSGGQRQRLTIARALVRKPEILILDDSASALDFATDAALRKAISEMKGNPTVFIVSQRASSLMQADLIIVLDDGKVAGMGTHEELLRGCEVYREIYNSQFKEEDSNE